MVAAWCMLGLARADVRIDGTFASHMVLQREKPIAVQGSAARNEEVTVEFAGQKKTAKADAKGKWQVALDPLEASKEPRIMVVQGATGAPIQFEDVLVGEVWLGAGQSNWFFNYEQQAKDSAGRGEKDEVLAAIVNAQHPLVRLNYGRNIWVAATDPDTNKKYSALMLAFGVALQKELDVPVGLRPPTWGNSRPGSIASKTAYEADPGYSKELARVKKETAAKHEAALKAWEEACRQARAENKPEPAKPAAPPEPGSGGFGGSSVPDAFRGLLYDHGEEGTGIVGIDRPTAWAAMNRILRKEWGQPDFPFLYVQKPVGGGCAWDPKDPVTSFASPFAPLPKTMPDNARGTYNIDREEYPRLIKEPGMFMVTSSDLGGSTHPTCKSGYGARAARVALGAVYGRKIEIYGPTYKSHTIEGSKVRVQFTHVGQGLAFRHGDKLQGFALAGDDRVFHWADAMIDGDAVVVLSPQVSKPVAVRYAWAGSPAWANLFNKDGLPALSFRTDNWDK
jgi:sialate O-acetylesterase